MLSRAFDSLDWVIGSVLPAPAAYHAVPKPSWESLATGPKPQGSTPIYRAPGMAGRDLVECCVAPTMADVLAESCERYADHEAIGWRVQTGVHKFNKLVDGVTKEWQVPEFGPRQTITYRALGAEVATRSAGIASLGLTPGTLVGIYEETRPEWMISLHALWRAGCVAVTVYANLGLDALEFAVNQTEMPAIVTSTALAVPLLGRRVPSLKTLLLLDEPTQALRDLAGTKGVRVVPWTELAAAGRAAAPGTKVEGKPEDLAVIMYTSGTTGNPKGVVMTHQNLTAAMGALVRRLTGVFVPGMSYCAYLPLAHVLELLAEHVVMHCGALLGYGTPRTLTDENARPHGDLSEWKPALFCGVPRVFDTIRKGALTKVEAAGGSKTVLGLAAFKSKIAANSAGRRTPVWDKLVFGKLRALVGGNVLHMISGGAPLNEETQQFSQAAFGVSVGQGYGLTETCAALTVQDYGDYRTLNVGRLVDCCEMKLEDVPDMNYLSTDLPHPRGEIVVRGPHITKGYYKEPAQTAEAYVDGWFHTGDVGELLPDGLLRVIDRKKNLVKLAMGEYVALERLEGLYGSSRFVMPNGICVVAIPTEAHLVALVLANKPYITTAGGVPADTWPAGLATPEARATVLKDLAAIGKKAGVKPFELIKDLELLSDEWTPENGILTAAQKLKRRAIMDRYGDLVRTVYKRSGGAGK